MKIAERSAHELTRHSLTSPERLTSFAEKIISCCIWNREFFELAVLCLNFDAITDAYDHNDFINPVDGLIFTGMIAFYSSYIEGNPWPTNQFQWFEAIRPHIDYLFQKNPEFPENFKVEAATKLVQLPSPSMGDYDRVCDGLVDYVTGVRYHMLESRMRNADPATKKDEFDKVPQTIRIPGAEPEIFIGDDMIAQIFQSPTQTHSFYTGVTKFDRNYANLAKPGDAWLVFGNSGAGKTVFSCQAAGYTAAFNKKVMFITTEVSPPVCTLRACSAQTKLSYDNLKSLQGCGDSSTSDFGIEFRRWMHEVGSNIIFFDYKKIAGNSFQEKKNRMMDKFEKVMNGPPDLIILDWIGKSIDQSFKDAWDKRETYNRIANIMADTADELGNVTITLAQADPKVKNKINIVESDTKDSKALADPMEGVLALTSLLDNSLEASEQEHDVHRKEQAWVIPKCRDQNTLNIPVIRRFDIQQFSDLRR